MSLSSEVKKLSQTYQRYIEGCKFSAKRQRKEKEKKAEKADAGRATSNDKPVYIVQPTAVVSHRSRTAASSPPRHARGMFLASAGSRASSSELRRSKSSPGVRTGRSRGVQQSGAFEYKTLTMGETEAEKTVRDNLLKGTKKQNWVESDKERSNSAYVTSTNSLGLTQRKYSVRAESADRKLRDFPRATFKTSGHFCDRALRLENDDFSKQFCDVFGPGMCSDCTRARRQYMNIEDHVQSFPEIAVSPHVLCVPRDDATFGTTSTASRERDGLSRRSLRRTSLDTWGPLGSARARPNSSNDARTHSAMSDTSVPYCINDASVHSVEGSWSHLPRFGSPYSSVSSSRRSSVSKTEEPTEQAAQQESADPSPLTAPGDERKLRAAGTLSVLDRLSPATAQEKRASSRAGSRLNSSRGRLKTPSIERTGKLKELPYWRFLIPEPPKMEVGRMNVSIYTPKEIPGIKIFDESFFEL